MGTKQKESSFYACLERWSPLIYSIYSFYYYYHHYNHHHHYNHYYYYWNFMR